MKFNLNATSLIFDPIVQAALTWVEHTQVHYWSYEPKDIYLFFCRTVMYNQFRNFRSQKIVLFYRSRLDFYKKNFNSSKEITLLA